MNAAGSRPARPSRTAALPGAGSVDLLRPRRQTSEMLKRLERQRFLAVVGASGSGKSSLVRAGLLPALQDGYLRGVSGDWQFVIARPGVVPFVSLADAFCRAAVEDRPSPTPVVHGLPPLPAPPVCLAGLLTPHGARAALRCRWPSRSCAAAGAASSNCCASSMSPTTAPFLC